MSQFKNSGLPSPTTFASLPREIRDQIYEEVVVRLKGAVAATGRPTDYGNCKGFEAIRGILHASTSNTQFAREAYEVYFHRNIFRISAEDLPEFVNRKSHYLKNKGYFDVNAWIGRLEVMLDEKVRTRNNDGILVNELRQLLVCPRLHTVSIRIEHWITEDEKRLYGLLQTIAEVCAQLREKMGDRFKVETDGKEWRGDGKRRQLVPWNLKSAASTP